MVSSRVQFIIPYDQRIVIMFSHL